MEVIGYEIGKIDAEAAMTSDIIMIPQIDFASLNNNVEIERRTMDVHAGINRKYTPFRYDPITGGGLCGGRYLFDTWANVESYFKWTEDLEFEPGVRFWKRPIFAQADKHIWEVVGAHDFTHLTTHGVNRFERWGYTAASDEVRAGLERVWPLLQSKAEKEGLGSVWLLEQPDEKLIAILTTNRNALEDTDVAALARSVETLEMMPSLGETLPTIEGMTKLFDRTSPIFSTWLPQSRMERGAPVINPSSPPWPSPSVAPQEV